MKKILLPLCFVVLFSGSHAQVDKTKLGLDVSKKYADNFQNLTQYTWKRKMEGFVEGKPVMSSLSSVSASPDGKIKAIVTQQQSYVQGKRGLRGAVQKSVVSDMNAYVKNAIELTVKYIYLSSGQLVDYFNKGTLSVLDNNVLQAETFNLLTKGDHLTFKYDQATLLYLSQDISTVMNGDPVKALVTYETRNGLNRVTRVDLTLPAVNVKVVLNNFEFAKKL